LTLAVLLLGFGSTFAAEPITLQGAGSFATILPPGAKSPPETILTAPVQTSKGPIAHQ